MTQNIYVVGHLTKNLPSSQGCSWPSQGGVCKREELDSSERAGQLLLDLIIRTIVIMLAMLDTGWSDHPDHRDHHVDNAWSDHLDHPDHRVDNAWHRLVSVTLTTSTSPSVFSSTWRASKDDRHPQDHHQRHHQDPHRQHHHERHWHDDHDHHYQPTKVVFRYDNNEMYTEALNTYAVITKNRMFNNAGKLKVMTFNAC